MRNLLLVLALLKVVLLHGQTDKTPTFKITQSYLYQPANSEIFIDLSSAELLPSDFDSADVYTLYYVDPDEETKVETGHRCRLILPSADSAVNVEFPISGNDLPIQLLNKPSLMIALNSSMAYGRYEIRVLRNGKKLRWRTLNVIEPDPVFSSLSVKYPGKQLRTGQNTINFDGVESLRGLLVKLDENVVYPEIKIGGLALNPVKEGPYKGYYKAGAGWDKVIPDGLNKVDPLLEIKKTLADGFQSVYVDHRIIQLPLPKIEASLNETLNGTESSFKFKLRVSNVFGIPKVHYKNVNGGDLLFAAGVTQNTILSDNILTFDLTLDKSKYSIDGKGIEFIVENQDGRRSDPKTTFLKQNPEGVTVSLLNQNTPYMAGFYSRVEFKLGASEPEIAAGSDVKVLMNGEECSFLDRNFSLDRKSVSGSVNIPAGLEGDVNFSFIYTDKFSNNKAVRGTFRDISKKPELTIVTPLEKEKKAFKTPVGQSFTISAIASDKLELIEPEEELSFLSHSGNSMIDGKIIFKINNPVPTNKKFKLSFRYGAHAIKTFDFKVVKGVDLEKVMLVAGEKDTVNNFQTFSGGDQLEIDVNNKLPINYSGMKAVLIDHNGTVKGDEYFLNSDDEAYSFLIDVASSGLKPGDLFYIRFSNPGSESIKRKYYYQRNGIDETVKISTGLSAGTIYFKEEMLNDSTKLPNAEFTNGLNFTLTYNPNGRFFRGQNKNFSKQPIGLAFTVSALQGDKLRARVGAGLNFFETIVLGIDKGISKQDTRAGFYIGVVSSFANIAGLFGGG